jgi:periplasmic copper chaperone A
MPVVRAAQDFPHVRLVPPLRSLPLFLCSVVLAQSSGLTASDAWIRVTPGTDVAAAYFTLHNGGAQPVVVTAVSSPRVAMAMIHETRTVNGQSSMRAHEELSLAPGETVRLEPGGLHVMLHQQSRPLAIGEAVPLILQLKGGGTIAVTARVRPLGEGG